MNSAPFVSARLVAVGLCLLSCGAEPAESTQVERAAVSGSEPSPESDDAVVKLWTLTGNYQADTVCTATLVAPNLVLTALHCIAPMTVGSINTYTCLPDGSLAPPDTGTGWLAEPVAPGNIRVNFGADLHLRMAEDGSGAVPDALGQQIFSSGSRVLCVDDIALVLLDRSLPVSGLPVRLEREVAVGETFSVVGYGSTERPVNTDRYRRDGLEVLAVGPDDTSEGTGAVTPRAFQTESGLCKWDEGAPALSEETGSVIGVYSRRVGGPACTPHYVHLIPDQVQLFTKVAAYANLIREASAAAASAANPPKNPDSGANEGCALGRRSRAQSSSVILCALAFLALCLRRWRASSTHRSSP